LNEFLLTLIAFGVGLFIKDYFPSYFSKKGENLATKEDIEDITKKIEGIKSSYSIELEKIKTELLWESKTREQAHKVAEYMSLARSLKEDSSEENYRKANTLSWELSMWLPDNVYELMKKAMVNQNENENEFSVLISVRKILLGSKSGNLTSEDIIFHAPNIGKSKKDNK
jgi:hypothetical protein